MPTERGFFIIDLCSGLNDPKQTPPAEVNKLEKKRNDTIYQVRCFTEGQETFDQQTTMQILQINHRATFGEYLQTLDIPKRRFTWPDIEEMLKLKLFLLSNIGGNTHLMYVIMRNGQMLLPYFAQLDINIEADLARLKRRYEARQPLTGQTRYTCEAKKSQKPQSPMPVMV